mgnify:CR=1 FL=1
MIGDCHIKADYLQNIIREKLNLNYNILQVIRIYGGAQKVTYKIECDLNFCCILYIWDKSMNYFYKERKENIIFESNGSDLFELNNRFLVQNGIRTPRMYYIDRSEKNYLFDFALVEFIEGGDIEKYFDADEDTQYKIFTDLNKNIKKMHSIKSKFYGNFKAQKSYQGRSVKLLLNKSLEDIRYSSKFHEGIFKNKLILIQKIQGLYNNIKPRNDYVFIHGEVGPNHVFVDEYLNTYLIDIESAMFFDIEYEHSFLELRFGEYYKYLTADNLDLDRLRFYKLHLYISCFSGALHLKQKGYPDMDDVNGMIEHNTKQALSFIAKLP